MQMIPLTLTEPCSSRHQRRRGCDPPTVSLPNSIRCTSADELCAASVLISLSPNAQDHHKRRPEYPPYCAPVKYPADVYCKQSWESYNRSNSSCSDLSSPGHTSDSGEYSSESSLAESSYDSTPTLQSSEEMTWHDGSVSLSLPEDDDVLSPLHCFMRRYCVEAFSASPEDVATPRYGKSHGVKVVAGQIGIRCLYCKHRPIHSRPERAVCYPSSLKNIYHSIETWQRRHSLVCKDITPWVRRSIVELMGSSKSRAGGRRQYWEESAMRLGMVDTPYGVRFSRPPGDLGHYPIVPKDEFQSTPVIQEEDRELVTEYLFCLLEQMETCRFTEKDRTGGRSKSKDKEVGFPGMRCKHCHGKAGFGRYFPSTPHALTLANSDRNIYNHIHKCRRCPQHIKVELARLSKDQSQSKNRRGQRKQFFKRVWARMHSDGS